MPGESALYRLRRWTRTDLVRKPLAAFRNRALPTGISLSLVVLALFIAVLELARHHAAGEAAYLSAVIAPGFALGSRILHQFITSKEEQL